MFTSDVTWGDLRAFHAMMLREGGSSPDDLLSQKEFAEQSVGKSDSEKVFEPDYDSTITYSVTTDEDKSAVLALVKMDEVEGRMFYRSGGRWIEVEGDEYPETIFEVPMYDIGPNSVDWVVGQWDEQEATDTPLTLDGIRWHLN